MDGVGKISYEQNLRQVVEAIQDVSKQLQALQQMNAEESERLEKYKAEGDMLEFILVTGGLIKGKILWIGNQSIGVSTAPDSDQDAIVYKHSIAFVQKHMG